MVFLRNLLATLLGLFIFSLVAFFLFVGLIASAEEETPEVKDKTVLWLKLDGILRERVAEDPFEDLFPGSSPKIVSLLDVMNAIKEAKEDPRVEGIYMEHRYLSAGYASLEEIRNALIDFKTSGKFIYAFGEFISESDYYLASVADEIFLHPQGNLEFNGLTANVTFFKGMFDKLEIEPVIFRVGTYKSAIEPLIRKDLSEENEEQLSELLNSLNGTYLENVAQSTGIELSRLMEIQNNLEAQVPEEAEELGLVTRVAHEDEIKSLIMEDVDEMELKDVNFMSYKLYVKAIENEYKRSRVAVIVGAGDIVMGGDENENIIGEKFAAEIRKARENSSVKAIVLRINSPGGSITASDMIWREVQRTKGVKPIIASMSTYAASGGYYMAMACDTIVAQPNTITGSIGIFSILFNLENFLDNKLGITNDAVVTGEFSDILTVTRPLTDAEKSIFQKSVNRGYDTFISKVAEGRSMDPEAVKAVASGRVWTGEQALKRGLVDVLGGVDDAISIAAQKAGLEDGEYRVSYYPRLKPFIEELVSRLGEEASIRWFGSGVTNSLKDLKKLEGLGSLPEVRARMYGDLEIR